MWAWMKYIGIALRLAGFFGNLQVVKASDPSTTAESYRPAAEVLLSSGDGREFLAKLTPAQQQAITAGLPLFVWLLDHMTE